MEAEASWAARLLIVGAIPPLAVFAVRFRRRQGRGALGGAISSPKAFWLAFALWFWFVVCPVVAFDGVVGGAPARALGAFGVSMWLRGAVEMVMLYVTRSWRPPLGIGHDVLCFVLVVAVLAWDGGALLALRGVDLWALGLCGAVLVSLGVEVHHAWSFHHAVQGRTTGEAGVWFADDEQERFRAINRRTRAWNVALSMAVGGFVLRYLSAGH